ncbi:MAG: hypothetical protein QM780_13165 [Hyphomicrobium sp.]
MNVESRAETGTDDIVSTGLELFTAADPISGPIDDGLEEPRRDDLAPRL